LGGRIVHAHEYAKKQRDFAEFVSRSQHVCELASEGPDSFAHIRTQLLVAHLGRAGEKVEAVELHELHVHAESTFLDSATSFVAALKDGRDEGSDEGHANAAGKADESAR